MIHSTMRNRLKTIWYDFIAFILELKNPKLILSLVIVQTNSGGSVEVCLRDVTIAGEGM